MKFFLFITLSLIFFYEVEFVDSIKNNIETLSYENQYVFIDLGISDEEFNLIDRLEIKKNSRFDQFGLLEDLSENLEAFLSNSCEKDIEVIQSACSVIDRICSKMIEACGLESGWVCVKTYIPNHEFDISRWHRDGAFYHMCSHMNVKLAATLIGNSTLFLQVSDDMRQEFFNHENDRKYLAGMLDEYQAEAAPEGFGTLYFTRDPFLGAIHTEPKAESSRLFLSIVPATSEEMQLFHPQVNLTER